MPPRFIPSAWLAAGVLCLLSPLAHAHAGLKAALPAANAVVATAPAQVELSFSQALEPALSRIEVRNAAGERVDRDGVHAIGGNAQRLGVALKPSLPPGTYRVDWQAASVDTHRTKGNFSFQVGK
ncbi:copper homeostasis periplasmic binding protein CopC [Pigmentiphaga aceris]|uniref:Copper homeostasis periplasmic binding protein CopC n=1 Tax=Pigmentiphaga aceris TaxID=1940612 RepID=A0A5C0AT91_9BURK|nr:copper homeostasis periplasmic binding protein CopC [Pigmentiphaga aceris]QEI04856.1 copper homeostasis periplasmic binding protein CopC [Pigmentiphaga aceris]